MVLAPSGYLPQAMGARMGTPVQLTATPPPSTPWPLGQPTRRRGRPSTMKAAVGRWLLLTPSTQGPSALSPTTRW